jgi:hypothetical protein
VAAAKGQPELDPASYLLMEVEDALFPSCRRHAAGGTKWLGLCLISYKAAT